MENNILIKVNSDENIEIHSRNNNKKIIINKNNRKIKATEIYDLLNQKEGVKNVLSIENKNNIDDEVVTFFYKLIDNIIRKLEEIDNTDNYSITDRIPF